MLPAKESLTVEFKSEQKRPQSHDEIVDNVVALANTEGGTLYLGIEDDGTVTGVCDEHRNINGLAALIFNKTVPQLPARVALLYENEVPIVSIEVGNSQQIVSTSQGKTLQRRLKADGSPEVVPPFISATVLRFQCATCPRGSVGRFESRLTEQVEKPYSQCQCAKLVVVFYG